MIGDPLTAKERIDYRSIPEPNSGCWIWLGASSREHGGAQGYGTLTYQGVHYRAHRFAWVTYRGPIPDGLFVCHRCDNPICVNPDHLFLGTHVDNMNDKIRKGRQNYPRPLLTQCVHGHAYTADNTYLNARGHRSCRACRFDAHNRLEARRRARRLEVVS